MIYLDNAATSFPKPRAVIDEMARCMRYYCGNAGRGSHRLALIMAEKIYACRERIADFFGSSHPENVCFCMNTTMAINMAIKGLLQEGDHVLISDMEHNAVLRPIEKLAREGKITYDLFPTLVADPSRSASRICTALAHRIKQNTKMVICSHVPNLCAMEMPLEEIGRLCRQKGLYFVVDAAQSAGHVPIDVEKMMIDALCVPAHKGLLGPQGCGFVLWGENIQAETLVEGGSGFQSLDRSMPLESPERFEAGTLPSPAIIGLAEGIKTVSAFGLDEIAAHERLLWSSLYDRLSSLEDITVYAPQYKGSVLLFNAKSRSADQIGDALNRRGICVRSGYHCAALGHQTLQTPDGGAIRVSFGIYNKPSDVDALFLALKEILQ